MVRDKRHRRGSLRRRPRSPPEDGPLHTPLFGEIVFFLLTGASLSWIGTGKGRAANVKASARRWIHFMPKDKGATVESIPFEF